ncbi:MAG: hypothetical protein JWQ38_2101 [Flavipsychrobacter sp.]|nr:hypothetical protein [Flavipsychrobacter sp.]
MSPDLSAFIRDVEKVDFQTGITEGSWGIEDDHPQYPSWPIVFIWIKASPKENHPNKFYLRFNLEGYPSTAPTACLWDMQLNTQLHESKRPRGDRYVSAVFHSGMTLGNALYLPCDRVAMVGHESTWRDSQSNLWWKSTFTIIKYVGYVHFLLTSADYAQV